MRGESSSMSSDRHGAADTADTSAAVAATVAVGGGPIMMTGISPSGLLGIGMMAPPPAPRRVRILLHEFKYLSLWDDAALLQLTHGIYNMARNQLTL